MSMMIDRISHISGTESIQPALRPGSTVKTDTAVQNAPGFDNVFQKQFEKHEPLKFSAHAQNRLLHRQIQLTSNQMDRLQHGVEEAGKKGARDSLVMLDNLAFVVSVRNNTVVTALDNAAQSGNVFTNIDSAIIA